MYRIKTANREYEVDCCRGDQIKGIINGKNFEMECAESQNGILHVLYNGRSFVVETLEVNKADKKVELLINGKKCTLTAQDDRDILLEKMGLSETNSKSASSVKAPMPGKVLDIMVKSGSKVKAGDPLLVLEAMKMENILKSPADGIVKMVNVQSEMAVAKDSVLLVFE